ncbi:MAG: Maf family protein [Bacteroidota bacterium]
MSPLRLSVPFVLASASPRRRHLLGKLGLSFDVLPSDADETWPEATAPGPAVEDLALRKAEAIARDRPEALVLGADTVVVLDGEVLGKPRDESEARATLARLAGRSHTVYTGLALVLGDRRATAHEATGVTFGALTEEEILAYVATGSPMDKAGAYGIQDDLGALFVAGVEGDYFNVVGLPLHRLYRTLRQSFGDVVRWARSSASGAEAGGVKG